MRRRQICSEGVFILLFRCSYLICKFALRHLEMNELCKAIEKMLQDFNPHILLFSHPLKALNLLLPFVIVQFKVELPLPLLVSFSDFTYCLNKIYWTSFSLELT